MKNIISATSCRTRNFPKYLFSDKRKENKHHFRVDRTDTLSNPLFIKIIEDNLKAALSLDNAFYENLQFQHPPNLRGNYWFKDKLSDLLERYNVKQIQCAPPKKYELGVFEVCSVKYQKSDKNYLSFNDFKSKIKSIEDLCDFPILWISSHNVKFTDEHKDKLKIPEEKFIKNQLISRKIVDDYMLQIIAPKRLILPSKVFSSHLSQDIFVSNGESWSGNWAGQEGGGNTHHYAPLADRLLGEEISKYIRHLF